MYFGGCGDALVMPNMRRQCQICHFVVTRAAACAFARIQTRIYIAHYVQFLVPDVCESSSLLSSSSPRRFDTLRETFETLCYAPIQCATLCVTSRAPRRLAFFFVWRQRTVPFGSALFSGAVTMLIIASVARRKAFTVLTALLFSHATKATAVISFR